MTVETAPEAEAIPEAATPATTGGPIADRFRARFRAGLVAALVKKKVSRTDAEEAIDGIGLERLLERFFSGGLPDVLRLILDVLKVLG